MCPSIEEIAPLSEPVLQQLPELSRAEQIGMCFLKNELYKVVIFSY